ncbi:class IV adenylate cyclase [Candidatus Dependentiae bacterium]
MNKEIEVKLQIDDNIFDFVKSWLNQNAKHIREEKHTEYYLNKPATSFLFTAPEGYKDAIDYLRVRFNKNGDTLCFKRFHEDPVEKRPLYCDEYEVKVSDGKVTLELFRSLGYSEQTLVEKNRNIYMHDCFEIVIDQVKNCGTFIEVELKKEVQDANVGIKLIYDFLKSMGITKFKLQTRGYVSMLWNPNYDFGKLVEL